MSIQFRLFHRRFQGLLEQHLFLSKFFSKIDVHTAEIINKGALAFVLRIVGAALTFAFNWLLARKLGADGAGYFFLVYTIATVATTFGRFGLDNVILRFTAANVAVENWNAIKGVYQKSMAIAVPASLAASLLVYQLGPLVAEQIFGEPLLGQYVQLMAYAIVPMSLMILQGEFLKGIKQITAASIIQLANGIGVYALASLGLLLLVPVDSTDNALRVFVGSTVIMALLGLFLWRRAAEQLPKAKADFPVQRLMTSALPLFWVTLLNYAFNWMGYFALGIWGTGSDVGIFGMASRLALLQTLVLFSMNSISAPKFAALYEQNDLPSVIRSVRSSVQTMTISVLPLFLIFLFFPKPIMDLFGPEFSEGVVVLRVLALGQFFNVITGPATKLLMMTGHEQTVRNITLLTAVLGLILNAILVPLYTATGAALATLIVVVVVNSLASYAVYIKLGFWIIRLPDFMTTAQ